MMHKLNAFTNLSILKMAKRVSTSSLKEDRQCYHPYLQGSKKATLIYKDSSHTSVLYWEKRTTDSLHP